MTGGAAPSRAAPAPDRDWDRLAAEAAAVDLVRLLEDRGYRPVWKRPDGEKATFRVPWRVDRHPSLGVYRRGQVWYWTDHARGESGTSIQAVQRLDGCSRTDAIRRLTGVETGEPRERKGSEPPVRPATPAAPDPRRSAQKAQARQLYEQARRAMTPERAERIRQYWARLGLAIVPDIGAVYVELEAGGRARPYLAIPLPRASTYWAVECRLLDSQGEADRLWRARTYGPKELWVHWRERPDRIVITESILDALAILTIWPEERASLVALNGVGNVRLLPALLQRAARAGRPIRTVQLALDADQAGRKAAEEAVALLAPLGVTVSRDREAAYAERGLKDTHKLLEALRADRAAGPREPESSIGRRRVPLLVEQFI
ncbi:toprim domain-containing protein [Nitrospira calida]